MSLLVSSLQQLALVSIDALDDVPAPEDVRPGWVAMGSFFLLFAVTILLWVSMRKQIGKIRFDDGVDRSGPGDPQPDAGEPGPDASESDDAPASPAPPPGTSGPPPRD